MASPTMALQVTGPGQQPFTTGYVFKEGEFRTGSAWQAVSVDGFRIPLQLDIKALHRDGSIRHAIVSGFTPAKLKNGTRFEIVKSAAATEGSAITLEQLIKANVNAEIKIQTAGKSYSLSLQPMLHAADEKPEQKSMLSRLLAASPFATSQNGIIFRQWLTGPVVSEWIIGGPLLDDEVHAHNYLAGYFHVRAYQDLKNIRVDFVIENNWTFQQQPQNITYDIELQINGKPIYQQQNLNHFHHARWHKSFWVADKPAVVITHDIDYLQSTGAVSNYISLQPGREALARLQKQVEPMSNGPLSEYMPEPGASPAIGPLPRWAALYVVSGDQDALQATLAGGDAGGTYSVHYRDGKTGLPVSIAEYPDLSWNGETLPKERDSNKYSHDQAHQPSIAYLPYLLSGDYFYLEELQFWANWNMLWSHHVYRQHEKGIIGIQVRGQAWALREIARAAYITPDDHPLKKYFNDRVLFNIEYNTQLYVKNPAANKLGALKSYDGHEDFAPWMDDFYTWMTGHLVELGFIEAIPLRNWKAQFPVGRMGGDGNNGYCYVFGAPYHLLVGPARNKWWPDFATLYQKNFAGKLNGPCVDGLEMTGYADSPTGYPSNMRPALAIAVDADVPNAKAAWRRFVNSAVQPDYRDYPNFALQPRISVKSERK
ncbi:MAG: hypothetical protein JXA04_01035 [Gammaproteobacteria bacterium]|nr:hypothetical protein [Gammaproteobacteria bacterium]